MPPLAWQPLASSAAPQRFGRGALASKGPTLARSDAADELPTLLPFAPPPAVAAPPIAAPLPESHALHASGVPVENAAGGHLCIRTPLARVWRQGPAHVAAAREPLLAQAIADEGRPDLAALARSLATGVLVLDLETCGFAGSPIFLAGVVCEQDGELMIEQLLARNHAEERSILVGLWERVVPREVLVTFNGKSFDWPMVQDRSTRHKLGRDDRHRRKRKEKPLLSGAAESKASAKKAPAALERAIPLAPRDPRPELVHFDLLHHARRRWKGQFANCRLQTLERHLCGRRRTGDVPGSEIPPLYHDYVRSGDPSEIEQVLKHNLLDLVTLLQLVTRLGECAVTMAEIR